MLSNSLRLSDATIGGMRGLEEWEFPEAVVASWGEAHGRPQVEAWVREARARVLACMEEWRLRMDGFLGGGSLSCVLACVREDGSLAVLKVLAPWAHGAIATEALALSAWQGCGVVRLLAHTRDGRALLVERVIPGSPFAPSGDDARDCARVAETLRAVAAGPMVAGLPPLSEALAARFERAGRAAWHHRAFVSAEAVEVAERGAVELAQSADRRVSVHGDAQNKNFLLDGASGRLVAMDPEASVGDPHFDAALWALTHRPGEGVRERCASVAGVLDLDAGRLWSWCRVLAVAEVALDLPERARAQCAWLARTAGGSD